MRKTKVEDKNEKSFDAFFYNEYGAENRGLSTADGARLSKTEANLTEKDSRFVNLLKQIFLFLPGTFFLYFVGFVGAVILMDIFIFLRPLSSLPSDAPFQIMLLGVVGFVGSFMTWFGLGDIKNKRHLAIPASIMITGAALAVIFRALEGVVFPKLIEQFNHFYFYLLPLILIIPVLAKGWVDRKAE